MSYKVWIDPQAAAETNATPGNVRQVLKQAMRDMVSDPRPPGSKELDWPQEPFQPRRLKIRNWRIIYAVDDVA